MQRVLMLVVLKAELDNYTKKMVVPMVGCVGMELVEAMRMEQVVAKERLVFGKNSNRCNSKNAGICFQEKKVYVQKIVPRIVIKTFYHLIILEYD